MDKVSNGVAWICIVSTLLMGCYTSKMIDPEGAEKQSIRAEEIRSVVLRDGTEYEFYDPPTIANDTLTGRVWLRGTFLSTGQQVSLPMSDVAEVSVWRYDPLLTVLGCFGAVVLFAAMAVAIAASQIRVM